MLTIKTGPTKVVRLTIWDNFERHCYELRAVGVPEDALDELRAAAQAVEDSEQASERLQINLARSTSPFHSCTGWVIKPPTNAARHYARLAVLKATGGKAPDEVIGEVTVLLAGLLMLRLWGEGKKADVFRLLAAPGELAQRLADESDHCTGLDPNNLASEWLAMMNIRPDKKKTQTAYLGVLKSLRQRHGRNPIKQKATTRASSSPRHLPHAISA